MNVVLHSEQDTVMPNAPMISNGLTEKQTPRSGTHQTMTKMLELDILDPAAQRWISGKLTALPKLTQPIHVPSIMPTDVKEQNVVIMPPMKGIIV